MRAEQNRDSHEVARRAIRAVACADVPAIEEVFAADVTLRNEPADAPGGLAGVRERALHLGGLFIDPSVEVLTCRTVAEQPAAGGGEAGGGETVLVRWRVRGRLWHFGGPALTRPMEVYGRSALRVVAGRVVEDWTRISDPRPLERVAAAQSSPRPA